jgi:hypothetical protein
MTLHAYSEGRTVTVSANSGAIEVKVHEAREHLKAFWSALGRALEETEDAPPAEVHEPQQGGF